MVSLTPQPYCTESLQSHVCPWQALGVRMGLYAGELLGLDVPRTDGRLLALTELDGCFADGITAATGCSIGHRTLRLVDHGKLAATFVDVHTGRAVRITPDPLANLHAAEHGPTGHHVITSGLFTSEEADAVDREAPHNATSAHAWRDEQTQAFQTMPAGDLLCVQHVALTVPAAKLLGSGHARTVCRHCGEEVLFEREVAVLGQRLCRYCAGERYFAPVGVPLGPTIGGVSGPGARASASPMAGGATSGPAGMAHRATGGTPAGVPSCPQRGRHRGRAQTSPSGRLVNVTSQEAALV